VAGVPVDPTASYTVAADVIGGVDYQYIKLDAGAPGAALPVNATAPLPVAVSGAVQISGTVTAGAGTTVVSLTGSALVSGTVTVGNGVSVTIQQGASVSAVVSGTVTAIGVSTEVSGTITVQVSGVVPVITQASASVTALPVIWSTAAVLGISSIVPVTTAASVSVSGIPVWMNPTQGVQVSGWSTVVSGLVSVTGVSLNVVVSGPVSISAMPAISISVSAILGTLVTIVALPYTAVNPAPSASTGLVVLSKDFTRIPFQIYVSSTIVGASTTLLMTVYTNNTIATTGASFFVPGSRMRVLAMNVVAVSSVVASAAVLAILYGTAAVSISVTATVGIGAAIPYFPVATSQWVLQGIRQDGPLPATTMGLGLIQGTSHTIQNLVITGYLF
jgi:hypothetical protein